MLGAGMLLAAPPAVAQTGNPGLDSPGDALSRNLRSLAENPKSLSALMGAGKAALELGDPQAAITFFGRAEEQAPRDGRIKMWIGASLVQLSQPQGALKFFAEAIAMGAPEAEVAGARGLAYDLLGDPRRAQRDYRMALQSKPSAEVSRHLALSLAISGEREPALQALEGQLLIRDRAAERTRAFVLALTGDAQGATRAVQASMPAQSAALTPFLERLPALTPAERALAVHLGHFPSHARSLPAPAPNRYASVDRSLTTRAGAPDSRQTALGSGTTPQTAAKTPVQRQPAAQPQRVAAAPKKEPARRQDRSAGSNSPWALARGLDPVPRTEPARKPASQPVRTAAATPPRPAAVQQQVAIVTPPPQQVPNVVSATPAQQQPATALPSATNWTQQLASAAPAPEVQLQQDAPAPVVVAQTQPPQQPIFTAPPATTPVQITAVDLPPSLTAPGFSLSAVSSASSAATAATAQPQQEPVSELASIEAPPPASGVGEERGASRLAGIASLIASLPDAPAAEPEPVRAAPKPAAKPPLAAKKETPAKVAAKKDPPAAVAKKPAVPAEPQRIWVQVAGGADKAALPREFSRLKAKAPKALAARSAWTTPLKATNRLLVGPFKTNGEAQGFVNELAKSDIVGFAWTSDAGQKIEKLSAK